MFEDLDEDKKLYKRGAHEFDPNSGGFGWEALITTVGVMAVLWALLLLL